MQLQSIDKQLYRSRLNIVIVACIVSLSVSSLAISQSLIFFLPSDTGSHFHWNLLGVVVSALGLGFTLLKLKQHPKMKEVVYVWQLKKELNLIYRKNRKLLAAAEQGNADAMLALQFSYEGSRQLWELDDNTIVMTSLDAAQSKLDGLTEAYNLQLDISSYQSGLLRQF